MNTQLVRDTEQEVYKTLRRKRPTKHTKSTKIPAVPTSTTITGTYNVLATRWTNLFAYSLSFVLFWPL